VYGIHSSACGIEGAADLVEDVLHALEEDRVTRVNKNLEPLKTAV